MSKENAFKALYGCKLGGNECSSILNEVGVVIESELNPVSVTVDSVLGGDNL